MSNVADTYTGITKMRYQTSSNSKGNFRRLHDKYVYPSLKDEDTARRQYIFNVLILGLLLLMVVAFVISFVRHITTGSYRNTPPLVILGAIVILFEMYRISRRRFTMWLGYILVGFCFLVATYTLFKFSINLPPGLLLYTLVIIIAGILLSARAALLTTVLVAGSISVLAYLETAGITNPYTDELDDPVGKNLFVYIFIFFVIFLASWLSHREVERSLQRARKSERLLRRERNMLETKIRERTRELEQAQVEKTQELYRFAEFGRLSSSLLHDLANPLTAVSLNLELLEGKQKSELMTQMREGINHMEQYVESARRQLRRQSENKVFDSKYEIEKVVSFVNAKAQANHVQLKCNLTASAPVFGDMTKFSQIVANLIANAIDACSNISSNSRRRVIISSRVNGDKLFIQVCDKGTGISKRDLKRVFEPFYTTKSQERGTGIGLTITKRLIEEDFSGEIGVSSNKEEGTIFTVILPLYDGSEE